MSPLYGNRNHPLRKVTMTVIPTVDNPVDFTVWGDEPNRFHTGGNECLDRMAAELMHLPETLTAAQRKRARIVARELLRRAKAVR